MPTSILKQLELLGKEIRSDIPNPLKVPNPWLFPAVGEVKGFMGTAPVMFVGERPSTRKHFGHADEWLYSLLEKYGAANAHLTDIIKSRGRVKEPYPDDIGLHRRVFDREIEIIKPCLIVAFGQKVYDLLQFSLALLGIKIEQVLHYAHAWRYRKLSRLEDQIRELDIRSILEGK